jgi:N-acetylneuraminic acid mutarotase
MKKLYWLSFCIVYLICSCQKDEPTVPKPVQKPIEVSLNVSTQNQTVKLSGSLKNILVSVIEQVGFVWSKQPDPKIDAADVQIYKINSASFNYEYVIEAGLAKDSTYYARTFYLGKDKVYHYSDQISFKSNGMKPPVLEYLKKYVTWGEEVELNLNALAVDDVNKITIQINNDPGFHPTRIDGTRVYFKVPNSLNSVNNLLKVAFNGFETNETDMRLETPQLIQSADLTLHESETLTINGDFFHPDLSKNVIKIGTKVLEVISGTRNQLVVKVKDLPMSESGVLTIFTGIDLGATSQVNYGLYKYFKVKKNFPGPARTLGVTLEMNGYLYFGLGRGKETSNGLNDWWRYNPINDEWQRLKDYPKEAWIVSGFVINNKAYVGMGIIGENLSKEFYCYDPTNNTWTTVAPFAGAMTKFPLAFSSQRFGYIAGGDNGKRTNEVWRFDPGLNAWKRIADCPGIAREQAMGFQIGTKQYMAGGSAIPSSDYDVFEFDLNAETWRQVADLPVEVGVIHGFTFSLNNKGYVGGGIITDEKGCSTLLYEYDPTKNSWKKKEQIIDPIYFGAGAVSIGNTAYIVGGSAYYGYHTGTQKFLQFKP